MAVPAVKIPPNSLIADFLLKFAGVLTAVAVAIATIGIPLPIPFVKDTSEPFPCMNCGCGCVNAEMCWRDCCCFTNSQKLAWANEHGLKAPEYLVAQVAAEPAAAEHEDLENLKPCCRARALAAREAACCGKKSGGCESKKDAEPSATLPGVLAIHALKCQGNSLSLSLLPPSVPTDNVGTELPLLPRESILLAESHLYQPPTFEAVVPPPEFAAL